jgi:hypothetical protein
LASSRDQFEKLLKEQSQNPSERKKSTFKKLLNKNTKDINEKVEYLERLNEVLQTRLDDEILSNKTL